MSIQKRLSDEQLISAVLQYGGFAYAADALKIKRRTIYERRKNPEFKKLFDEAKRDLLRATTAKLQSEMISAVDTLSAIMKSEDTAAQTRANCACYILQYATRLTEMTDLVERVEELESKMQDE